MNKQYLLSLVAFTCLSTVTYAQQNSDTIRNHSSNRYRQTPVWIDMMNDPNVNYF